MRIRHAWNKRRNPFFLRVTPASSVRWILGFIAAGSLGGGCDCNGQVDGTAALQVAITGFSFPTTGATITSQDDRSTDEGIQIDVRVDVQNGQGQEFRLVNSVDVDSSGAPIPVTAVGERDQVAFLAYTLPEGDSIDLIVSVGNADCTVDTADENPQCAAVRIQVVESFCRFVSPTRDALLTQDQYPGAADDIFDPFETDVVVDCAGVDETDSVVLSVNGVALPAVLVPDESGDFKRVTFSRVRLGEGESRLTVTPVDSNRGPGTAETIVVRVDTGRCNATIEPIDQSRILFDRDVDQNSANGMQATIDVTTDCLETSTVELYLCQRSEGDACENADYTKVEVVEPAPRPALNGTEFRFSSVTLPESLMPFDVSLVAIITEPDAGRTGASLPVTYWVDTFVPVIANASPGALDCFGVSRDVDADRPGIQVNGEGLVQGAQDGSEVWVRVYNEMFPSVECTAEDESAVCGEVESCREGFCRIVSTVSSGGFTFSGFTLLSGESTIEYLALDAAGNRSSPLEVQVQAVEAGPGVTIAAPAAGSVGPTNDQDPSTPGVQLTGQVSITNPTAATNGKFTVSGVAQTFDPADAVEGLVNINLSLLDGTRTLVASVEDACGDTVTDSRVVSVRSVLPEISVTAYEAGQLGNRDAIFNRRATAVTSVDLDIGVGESSEDRTVNVTRALTYDDMNDTCTGSTTAVDSQAVASTNNAVLVSSVPLSAGVNCFELAVSDSFGSVSRTYVVNRVNSGAGLSFVTASPLMVSAPVADDTKATFELSFGGTLLARGVLTLTVGEGVVPPYAIYRSNVDAGVTAFSAADVSIPSGDYQVSAVFVDEAGNVSNTATVDVQVSDDLSGFAITAPRSDEVVVPTAGEVSVSLAQVVPFNEDSCSITVNGGSPQSFSFTAGNATVDVPVPEGEVTLEASCSEMGAGGFSNALRFFARSSAPAEPVLVNEPESTPGRVVYDSLPAYVNLQTLDQSSEAGFQRDVSVQVPTGGARPSGWMVQLSVTETSGGSRVYSRPVTEGQWGDPAIVVFPAVDFGDGDGDADLSVVVMDAAPRTSNPDAATITVDRTAPTLVQIEPAPKDNAQLTVFTREDDRTPFDLAAVDLSWTYSADDGQPVTLTVVPGPANLSPSGEVFMATAAGGAVTFSEIPFVDGEGFSAVARAIDAAGNASEVRFENFNVSSLTPQAEFKLPGFPGTLDSDNDAAPSTGEFQAAFRVDTTGIALGATVRICSTIAAPGAGTTPCLFGFESPFDPGSLNELDGAVLSGTELQGFVVAEGTLAGDLEFGTFFNPTTTLAQGEQWVHFEVEEADLSPQVASEFLRFTVDSEPPRVTALSFPDDNDASGSELDVSDGTPSGSTLTTTALLTLSGAEDGRLVEVFSNLGGVLTRVGSGSVASGMASLSVVLSSGVQTLSVRVSDGAGNRNDPNLDPGGTVSLTVDPVPPTLLLPEPSLSVYSSQNGTVDGGASAGAADDRLLLDEAVAVSVSVSDNLNFGAGDCNSTPQRSCLVVQAWSGPAGSGVLNGEMRVPLSSATTSVSATALPLAQGDNYLRGVLTDALGNEIAIDTVAPYVVDFQGPTLSLRFSDNGSAQACADFAAAAAPECVAVMSGTGSRQWFDAQDDIEYSVSDCDIGGESCDVSLRLESRIVDATQTGGPADARPFSPVSGATLAINGNTAGFASVTAGAPTALFDAGQIREVRMTTLDVNGNASASNSIFLTLGIDGVIIEVERLAADGLSLTGERLEEGTIYGISDNTSGTASFATHFRVRVTQTTEVPSQVTLDNGAPVGTVALVENPVGSGIFEADFLGVSLTASPAFGTDILNLISVDVDCVSSVGCGERLFADIIVDIDAPSYEYDRCSLCDFNIPLVGDEVALCAMCPVGNSGFDVDDIRIEDPTTETAVWNIALDQDGNPDNGFSSSTLAPIKVIINDVHEAPRVELRSSQSSLGGGELLASGCSNGVCTATYANLSVPTLANGLVHDISADFVDRAGNAAVPTSGLGDEVIHAITDVTRPASSAPTVCLGESTTPTVISDPATDPRTYDDPGICADQLEGGICTAASCDRLAGNVAVSFLAPADDLGAGDPVTSYRIHAVPLAFSLEATSFGACEDVTLAGPFEQSVDVTPQVNPGERETATVSGLNLARSYCFFVEAIDDVGNASSIQGFHRERVLPWLTDVPEQAGVGAIVAFDPNDPDLIRIDAYAFEDAEDPSNLTTRVTNLGDMDGDGRDDLAVGRSSPSDAVWLFFSMDADLSTPSVVIEGPTSTSPLFSRSIAAGDIDNDGLNDLAIAARDKDGVGAVYVWWGVSGNGIRRDLAQPALRDDLPSINPDFWLLGPSGSDRFGAGLAIVDLDDDPMATGDAGEGGELLISNRQTNDRTTVWGYIGGARERFNWMGVGNPPVALAVDPSALFGGAPGEDRGRPNIRIRANPNGGANDGALLRGADVDADGVDELVVGVRRQDHDTAGTCDNCGEVYVFDALTDGVDFLFESGNALGTDGAVQPFAQLASVHRYRDRGGSSENFGGNLTVLTDPLRSGGADWVVAGVSPASEVVVLKGGPSGLMPANMGPGGLPLEDYTVLTATAPGYFQEAITSERFGTSVCVRQDERVGFQEVFVLSRSLFDSDALAGAFKFVIGPDDSLIQKDVIPGRQQFGLECAGLGSYLQNSSGYLFGVGASQGAGIVIR